MLTRIKLLNLFIITALVLAACGGGTIITSELKSSQARQTNPNAPAGDTTALVKGNTVFALDLYQKLSQKSDTNLFFSPYSISLALAMTYAGARGQTEKEMAQVMHYTLPQTNLHAAFNALDQQLASREQLPAGLQDKGGRGFKLRLSNAFWAQKNYTFLPTYLDLLAVNYGGGVRLVDYQTDTEGARKTINQWVSDATEQKIKELLKSSDLTPLTRLVLTNTIYFNASWAAPFDVKNTQTGPFTKLDGSKVDVPLMSKQESLQYFPGKGYQAVEIPYLGGQLSMLVILPDAGQFKAIEKTLDAANLESIRSGLGRAEVKLWLPKFNYESRADLAEVLQSLGMVQAFDEKLADLSGMNGDKNLVVKKVIHQANVAVDESGTEAAAATAVIIGLKSMPGQIVEMRVDRPFIFVIQDKITGTVLFTGRVMQP